MFERFTERARQVVVLAQEEARTLKHNYIGTEHILLGLLREEEGLAARVLESLDITVERVRAQVVRIVGSGEEVTSGQIPFTPRAKKVLELALREALSLGHNYIGTEHILLGLVRENEGVAARILLDFDADSEKIRNEVIRMLSGPGGRRQGSGGGGGSGEGKKSSKLLDQFGRNLTKLAAEGKLDPVIGRETEIERIMQILSRRQKNNPVLLGEPGVGKTAIVEGLASRITQRRGARAAQGQADLHARPGGPGRRLEVPRRVRGAAEEGDEGDHPARRHRPLHRRAPQPGRRRRRRGRDRRGLDPEAGAGPRRAADDRRDDARRVPQVPRARLRARAPLPADQGRRALDPGHREDPRGAARALRGPPPGRDHRRRPRRRRRARRPLHLRPLPARQGDRPDRRGRLADADQVDDHAAGLPRPRGGDRGDPPRQGGRDRGPGVREGRQPARQGAPADQPQARARGRVGARARAASAPRSARRRSPTSSRCGPASPSSS